MPTRNLNYHRGTGQSRSVFLSFEFEKDAGRRPASKNRSGINVRNLEKDLAPFSIPALVVPRQAFLPIPVA